MVILQLSLGNNSSVFVLIFKQIVKLEGIVNLIAQMIESKLF